MERNNVMPISAETLKKLRACPEEIAWYEAHCDRYHDDEWKLMLVQEHPAWYCGWHIEGFPGFTKYYDIAQRMSSNDARGETAFKRYAAIEM